MRRRQAFFLAALLVLAAADVVLSSGGTTSISLAEVLKRHAVESVFVGEMRGYERRDVSGAEPAKTKISKETGDIFHNYSYMEISFTVIPKETLHGDVVIGEHKQFCFREMSNSYHERLMPDGSFQDVFHSLGFVSTGSGGERNNQFSKVGKTAVFFVGTEKVDTAKKLLRVEPADRENLRKIRALLDKE